MTIRSKPYLDKDTTLPACYRCLGTNPLINMQGDKCTICHAAFIRSPISHDILPLIEFKPVSEIDEDKAIEVIKTSTTNKRVQKYI
jgi:hypothetical protein